MPTKRDKGHTDKQGSGIGGGQKAVYGSTRSPEVAEAAAEAREAPVEETPEAEG